MARKQREILRQAERRMCESMTDEELQAIIDSGPPDPEFDAALPLLSIAELEMVLDDLLTRDQIISLAASRTHPAESHTT